MSKRSAMKNVILISSSVGVLVAAIIGLIVIIKE